MPSLKHLLTAGLAAAIGFASLAAQTTVFEDTFASSTLNSTSPAAPTSTSTAYQLVSSKAWNPEPSISAGSLKFGIAATSSGHIEAHALFSATPVQLLNVGEYIELTLTFTNTSGLLTNASHLGIGLYDANGVQPVAGGLPETAVSGSTTHASGGAKDWKGYVNRIFYAGGNNKLVTRPAQTGSNNTNQALLTEGSSSQSYQNPGGTNVGSNASSSLTLVAGSQYTYSLKIALTAASTYQIDTALYAGTNTSGTSLYTQSGTASGGTFITTAFDALAIGWRSTATATGATAIEVHSIKVVTNSASYVPPTPAAPIITTQPADVTVTAPAPVSLSVTATGATSYQWKKDGNDITGATASTFVIDPSSAADSGSYTVVVSNATGSVTSNAATVTVNAPVSTVTITTQPVDVTVTAGEPASFTVAATGDAPIIYQWEKEIEGTFTPILGATSATYALASTSPADAGNYRAVVTNPHGSATSSPASLIVNAPVAPSIVTPPSSLSISVGAGATFSVTVTGTAPFTYQWLKNGTEISGATASSYSIASVAESDAGNYSVRVTNAVDSVTSSAATLTVNTVPPTGTLKVDINRNSNNSTFATEPGYQRWNPSLTNDTDPSGLNAMTKTFITSTGGTVTVSFSQTALSQTNGGTGLQTNWYRAHAETDRQLIGDGVTVAPANLATGGQIQMTLTGLSAGTHTLATYHNAWDNLTADAIGPMSVSVNGTPVVASVQPTIRAVSRAAVATAFVQFTVDGPSDVVTILFTADPSAPAPATIRNVVINGFDLNLSDPKRRAHTPSPFDGDEHADADSGSVTLSWSPSIDGSAVSHDVYFGTDPNAVAQATRSSPEFKGNQTATSYAAAIGDRQLRYYWRIDEVDTTDTVTKGDVWSLIPRQLAFPGAEGYGRFARGGRGGVVVKVTSLADYGANETPIPGTLRYAIEQVTGPRTIIFDVGGMITLESRLTINTPRSYVTVAGQTAPGKGITTRKWTMGLSGSNDVIVRFVRSRPGNISGVTIDGMGMAGADHAIFDHCSISWSIDEAFSSRNAKNITLQRTIIAEALNAAGHQNYPAGTEHGYAASIGGNKGSFHHNLLAHNYGRNWSLAGGLDLYNEFAGRLDIRNNVVYNWGSRTTDGGAMEVNFINNYYKPGAGSTHFYALTMNHEDNFGGSQRAYFTGNVMPGRFDESTQTNGRRSIVSNGVPTPTYETFVDAPFFDSFVTTQSAYEAYKRVLSDVGANRPIDTQDTRIITETLNGTFTYRGSYTNKPGFPDSQDDVGGWEDYPTVTRPADYDSDNDGMPDWWEELKGLNKNSAPGDFSEANADPDNDGYTNLEDFLNWLAVPNVEVHKNGSVSIDLSQLTRGYTASPVHTVSAAQNGTVSIAADGKTATFTPTADFSGLASFDFGVTDAEASSMSGTINIRVLPNAAPPTIATQPASQSVDAGGSVTFTVVATGSNLTYQWKKNGIAITGETSASLTLNNVGPGDESAYTVDVTGDGGTITSEAALLTVNVAPPAITTQPSAQSVALGGSATFSVVASGSGTLTYQWQKNGADIAGANEASYNIATTQISDLGEYRVVVTSPAGSVTSNAVALTLKPPAFAAPVASGFAASATGGGNATPVLVATAADFKTHAESASAAVIVVAGILDLNTLSPAGVSVKSNKTIQGLNADATLSGPVTLGASVTNVIFRGLNFTHPTGTPLTLSGASLVHVQNSTFFDGGDHLAKIVAGSDNVTFAWCEFYFSSASLTSRNGVLVGNTSGETKAIRVSFAYNWWSDFIDQRMPSITYGQVHQFGNYLKAAATPNTAGVAALANSQLLSERNAFSGIVAPIAKSGGGLVRVIENLYTSTSTSPTDADAVFVPPYSYVTLKNDTLAAEVSAQAGNTAGAASVVTAPTTTASINGPSAPVANGASFTLNAVSTLSGTLTYQWRLNNAPINGATSAAYTVTNAQTSHSGIYTAAITTINGTTIVSSPFTVTVNAPAPSNPNPPPSGGGGGGGSPSLGFFAALAMLALLRRMCRAA